MCKSTKNSNNYNEDILNALHEMFGFSIDYIRKCLRGDRTGIMPDEVCKYYKKMQAESKRAIENASK